MPAEKYRHAVICLTDYTAFSRRITKPDVPIYSLHKPPGLGLGAHVRLWHLLRQLKPSILHTYNLSALEYGVTAVMANVPIRVHGEHGRDANDPQGTNRRHNQLRRWMLPFYDSYYAVSADLSKWLTTTIGVPDKKNRLLANGIDTNTFRPIVGRPEILSEKLPAGCFVIGTVGRMQEVKNHSGLIDAFILLLTLMPEKKSHLRLAIIGDGPLSPALTEKIAAAGIADQVWLPGARSDVADIMRTFSLFVLSSIAEGTPITVLEAMATGLPVLSTRVGGVPEVVIENVTGMLVPASDPIALANAMAWYVNHPDLVVQHGLAGKARVDKQYGMAAMLLAYTTMYDDMSAAKKITLRRG